MTCDGTALSSDTIIAQLKGLSTAEEFFEALDVSYEPKVLDVSRLHIMKRMGQYLAEEYFSDHRARARDALERAYVEFATCSPLSHRVFRVLQQRDPTKTAAPGQTFVSLDSVLKSFGSDT
ncbi:nitrogenase stabilizing/protective protein NifW [Agrobacterium pusense]|uniref:Nitrogenase-stabilizing/protective protein NifW n=1 Tax=Agrobacterium pusense TaxID=648995 RepID=U4Q441_9HYPH|nr:nitrogenase stabilizing/protective protein NifW [Agrobacterium pusense]CDI12023.1 nitrogenase stabilizer NifW [Agrobacterium pusense]